MSTQAMTLDDARIGDPVAFVGEDGTPQWIRDGENGPSSAQPAGTILYARPPRSAQVQQASAPEGWVMVPTRDVTSDMIRVGMEWITNCKTDFDRACMVTCIFGEMCKVAPQTPSIDGLSKSDLIRSHGNIDESVPVLASGAQEEASGVVDVGLDSAEHDLNTTVLARPHDDESTPSAAAKSAVRS